MPAVPSGRTASSLHVALLRGINVGGKNKLAMKRLAALVEEAGGADVRTYIQSGNVVFACPSAVARRLPRALAEALAREVGTEIAVVTRTADELRRAARGHPLDGPGVDPKELHVGFLADRPARARAGSLDPDRSRRDTFTVRGRELYLRFPNGAGRTKLTTAYLERTLGTVCTVRNWRTVQKLRELVG